MDWKKFFTSEDKWLHALVAFFILVFFTAIGQGFKLNNVESLAIGIFACIACCVGKEYYDNGKGQTKSEMKLDLIADGIGFLIALACLLIVM